MPEKPTSLPQWATDANRTLEPSAGQKGTGWEIYTRGPARIFNWLFNLTYRWLQYLDAPKGADGVGTNDPGGPALVVTGGDGNGTGLGGTGIEAWGGASGTGTGGVGVRGIGGLDDGTGVQGQGRDSGAGVQGIGGSTGGTGVIGVGSSGYGVVAQSDTTSPSTAAFHIEPQDSAPSGPNAIGDFYVTTAGVLYICTIAGTPGTWTKVGAQ